VRSNAPAVARQRAGSSGDNREHVLIAMRKFCKHLD